MRFGSVAINDVRSAESIRDQRAISGNVRPQPRQRSVFGSMKQTAMHGVSLSISGSEGIFVAHASAGYFSWA